jgi:xanthine dehydrogenase accessory factor
MRSFFDALLSAIALDEKFALGIISGVKGSSPQKKGAKALFFADGRIVGTLGGGCLEAEVRRRACEALISGEAESFDLVLDHDFGWDDGLICGGKVGGLILPRAAEAESIWRELASRQRTMVWGVDKKFTVRWALAPESDQFLYKETVTPPCALWIAGSGHVARAVAPLAQQLDFEVTVFDDRPALADPRFFPEGTQLRVDYWEKLLGDPVPDRPTFGLIVTRGHQHDALVLRDWIQKPFSFLGMIGSKRKKRVIFSHFVEQGIATEARLLEVACPVGIDIDAVSVPEIAVSIMAQYIQERARLSSKMTPVESEERQECLAVS